MSTARNTVRPPAYHPDAYRFVDQALRFTQRRLGRLSEGLEEKDEPSAHISGRELLDGIRELALNEFGLLTIAVFQHWGIRTTDDFGRIVFDFIDRGFMRKTDQDQLSDFSEVYDFAQAFDLDYAFDLKEAFNG